MERLARFKKGNDARNSFEGEKVVDDVEGRHNKCSARVWEEEQHRDLWRKKPQISGN